MKTLTEKDTCTPVFIAALFTMAKTWKQPKCPLRDTWINKIIHSHTLIYTHTHTHTHTHLGPRESRALSLPFRQPLRGRQLVQEIPVDLVMLQSVFRFGDFTRPGRGRAKSGSVPGRLGGEAGPRAPSPPGGRAPEHRVRGRRPPCRDQHGSRPPSCSRSLGGASPVPVAWPQEGHRLPPGLGRLV